MKPFGVHLIAANTNEAGIRIAITERPDQAGTEDIPRCLTGDNGSHVVAYGTEGGLFQEAGISTVMCGPGSIVQAHQPDEFIAVSQVEEGIAFMRKLFAWAEQTA